MIKKSKRSSTLAITSIIGIIVIVGAIVLLTNKPQLITEKGIIGNKIILDEISRLSGLGNNNKITVEDLENLEKMVRGDKVAEHELHEIEVLTKYKEYLHVTHTLGFLGGYISTGKETLCPAHLLSHYYVFLRHGETELSEESLEESEKQSPEWVQKAREFNEKYPSGQNFDELVAIINSHVEAIENGDTVATDEEIDFLANRGLCVQV